MSNLRKAYLLQSTAKKTGKIRELLLIVFTGVFVSIAMLAGIGMVKLNEYSAEIPTVEQVKQILEDKGENSKIYDRRGKLLYTFKDPDRDREYAEFDEIPSTVVAAVLAAEDKDFYIHGGIDFFAAVQGIITTTISEGTQVVGGSTITQQLVKQTLLTSERSIDRKIKEAMLTIVIEKEYTKDQILELYLNSANFGGRVQGIKTAARAYFDKPLADLSLNEAVFLISLVQSPGELSPLYANDPERATVLSNERRKLVLEQVINNPALIAYLNTEDTSYLSDPFNQNYPVPKNHTQETVQALQEENLKFKPPQDLLKAAHWVFYIRDILQQEPYNLTLHDLYNGGYQIITSIDLRIQELAEWKVKEGVDRYGYLGFQNASLVTVDARNGEILAMVGSKGYNLPNDKHNKRFDPKVNVAIAEQSLGSSLKPWVAYLAFTTNRYYPWSEIEDKEVTFYGTYKPKNFDGRFWGMMSVKTALLQSRNLPWLQIAYDLGDWQLPKLMTEIGYNKANQYGLAAVIGGVNESLLSHTAAYTAFANGGTVLQSVPILNINDSQGQEIFRAKTLPLKELNREAIATVNDILGDKYYTSGGNYMKFFGNNKLAGKTGTSDQNRDAYFMGYNPKLVTGVWVGNNDNSPMSSRAYGSSTALPIWRSYMQALLGSYPKYAEAGSY